jgi:hypothetical protein
MALLNETDNHTPEQLDMLEKELVSALDGFEPIVKEMESERPEAVQIDAEELEAMFAELRPLLEKGDFGAAGYAEKLLGVEGMEELAERIDDYDFEGALQVLNDILSGNK